MVGMEGIFKSECESEKGLQPEIQTRRNEILRELAESEDIYLSNLKTIITHYREDFHSSIHGGPTIAKIFSSVREIFKYHEILNKQLKVVPPSSSTTQAFFISTIFSSTQVNFDKLYSSYCTTYVEYLGILINEKQANPNFAKFLNEKQLICGGRDLTWFLRIPIQRLIHYHYLFTQLLPCCLPESTLEYCSTRFTLNSILEVLLNIERKIEFDDQSRAKACSEFGIHPIQGKSRREGEWYNIVNSSQEEEGWNLIIIGDDNSRSKTRLLHTYLEPEKAQSQPLRFRNYIAPIYLEPPFAPIGQTVILRIWDTTGFEEFEKFRALNYPLTDAIILTFSIASKDQFANIIPKWYREIKKYLNKVPMILVGLDGDLREKKQAEELVSENEIKHLTSLLSIRYIEIVAMLQSNLEVVFNEAASCFTNPPRHQLLRESDKPIDEISERILAGILDSHLDLSACNMGTKDLPKEILYCSQLTSLDLSWNGLSKLPTMLRQLTSLTDLNLSHNNLEDVNGIELLSTLKSLNLEANQLNFLPPALGRCTNLLTLNMIDNPLDTLPKDIFPSKCFDEDKNSQSRNQLFAYLRSIQEGGQAPHFRVKVMFVGDGEVGKTSLLNSFQELGSSSVMGRRKQRSLSVISRRKLEDLNTPPPITDGIEISELVWVDKESNDTEYVWDCWDYAGQSVYYTTHQFFLSAGAVYLVIFNLLNRDFSRIEYWLNSVHTRARGSPIILIGTHLDEPACTPEYVEEYKNDLRNRYLKRFKNKLGVPSIKHVAFISTRLSKRGQPNDYVKALFDRIGQLTVKNRLVGKLYPQSWIGLEKHIRSLSSQTDNQIMSWEKFQSIAVNCSISPSDVPEAAAFLHNSGVLCYFNDEKSGLSDLVILDPQFLTNAMSAVVSLRQNFISQGEILRKNLVFIWRAFDQQLHQKLMALLELFEIAFSLPSSEGEKYLIPSLLPENQPSTYTQIWPNLDSTKEYLLGRVYIFKFMPLGFFSRLFVRTLHLPAVRALEYWRNGVVITNDIEKATIRYNPTEYRLSISVRGLNSNTARGQLLRYIVENVETVIEGWYETEVDIMVPCAHCYAVGSYSPYMFSLGECIAQITDGNCFVYCNGIRKIRIDMIAPDITFADLKKTKLFDFTNDLQVERVLGQGTFGRVYSAKLNPSSPHCGKEFNELPVAVKVLEKTAVVEYEEDPEFKLFNEFQREVWIMSCLKHRNLVHLTGLCLNPLAMIMPLLELGDLYHILYPKNPEDEVLMQLHMTIKNSNKIRYRMMLDIAKGMRYLHTLSPPIIHRDLRSPNIFIESLTEDDNKTIAKVGDFGLSRLIATTLAGGEFNLNWLAPEVMKEDLYNEKIDVYSFGIIINELVSFIPPFVEYDHIYAGRPREVFKKAVIGGLRPSISSECPDELQRLIRRCWEADPESRPPFTEIIPILVSFMQSQSISCSAEDEEEDENMDNEDNISLSSSRELKRLSSKDDLLSSPSSSTLTLLQRLEPQHPHSVQCLIVVPLSCDNHQKKMTVWAGCRSGVIRIWDLETMTAIEDVKVRGSLYTMHRVMNYVWVSSDDGSITAFETNSPSSRSQRKSHRIYRMNKKEIISGIRALIFLKEADFLPTSALLKSPQKYHHVLSGDLLGNLVMWKVQKKSPLKKIEKEKVFTFDSAIDCFHQSDDYRVWIGTKDKITVLDPYSKPPKILASWVAHRGPVYDLTSYENKIWSVGHDGCICIWDANNFIPYIQDPNPIKKINAHSSKVSAIERVGTYIVSGSFDMSLIVYDPKKYTVIAERTEHKDGIRSIVSISDDMVWSGSMQRDATICVWTITDKQNNDNNDNDNNSQNSIFNY